MLAKTNAYVLKGRKPWLEFCLNWIFELYLCQVWTASQGFCSANATDAAIITAKQQNKQQLQRRSLRTGYQCGRTQPVASIFRQRKMSESFSSHERFKSRWSKGHGGAVGVGDLQ
jgi:ribonuclease HI